MPLVLSLRKGDDIYVADQHFEVTRIYDDTSFTLAKLGNGQVVESEFEITEVESVEIMPDVFVSAGDLFQSGIIRAVLDAPKSILILRGDRYREGLANVS